jgi:hypothetical protein
MLHCCGQWPIGVTYIYFYRSHFGIPRGPTRVPGITVKAWLKNIWCGYCLGMGQERVRTAPRLFRSLRQLRWAGWTEGEPRVISAWVEAASLLTNLGTKGKKLCSTNRSAFPTYNSPSTPCRWRIPIRTEQRYANFLPQYYYYALNPTYHSHKL